MKLHPHWIWAAHGLMPVIAVTLFLFIQAHGESPSRIAPDAPRTDSAPAAAGRDILFHVLLALATVIVVGRVIGAFFRVIGQPPVIGEVVAGIVLGPSLLGQISPTAAAFILPGE